MWAHKKLPFRLTSMTPLPVVEIERVDRGAGKDRCVVDQHVDTAEAVHGVRDHPLDFGLPAEIGPYSGRVVAGVPQCARRGMGGTFRLMIMDDELAAAFGQRQHDGLADPPRATGHQGNFVGEIHAGQRNGSI